MYACTFVALFLAAWSLLIVVFYVFFCTNAAPTEIYTLSLHDALPISWWRRRSPRAWARAAASAAGTRPCARCATDRSEEHTSELQSLTNLVCRLLLEKKKRRTRNARSPRAPRPPEKRGKLARVRHQWT